MGWNIANMWVASGFFHRDLMDMNAGVHACCPAKIIVKHGQLAVDNYFCQYVSVIVVISILKR